MARVQTLKRLVRNRAALNVLQTGMSTNVPRSALLSLRHIPLLHLLLRRGASS